MVWSLTVMEDSVDRRSRDFALRYGEIGEADTSGMEAPPVSSY